MGACVTVSVRGNSHILVLCRVTPYIGEGALNLISNIFVSWTFYVWPQKMLQVALKLKAMHAIVYCAFLIFRWNNQQPNP